MKTLPITTEGAVVPANICAAIRHPLMADLEKCRRDRVPVAPEYVEAVETIDAIGAWWENKKVSDVSPDVSLLESRSFAPVDQSSMTVSAAAHELKITPQAVRRLLKRGTLHGSQRDDRSWRVSVDSVSARKDHS
jgi:hypothetical protein